MLNNNSVAEHYVHGNLLHAIQSTLSKIGKTIDTVSIEDLGPVDEFHIGGRIATDNFLKQLKFSEGDHILDVGCGLGGATRYVADQYNAQVTGIDLTVEYIETGNALSKWVKLDKRITLQHESALAMSFKNDTFDGGYMLHVAMNIEDKVQLFKEIYRVLRPSSSFGVYDIMRDQDGEIAYPQPWASDKSTSVLATAYEYKQALSDAGFEISTENNRRDFALEFFKNMRAKTEANGGPPPLGLHTLMKESTPIKLKNMVDAIASNCIMPVEIIAQKK